MNNKDILQEISSYLNPIMLENNLELFDVELVKEGANWYLRIYIDKDNGVTIDDCELVSKKIENILDEKDPISFSYILEVSSPGIDRPLKKDSDYEKYKGKMIDVKLYSKKENTKELQGELVGLKEDIVTILDKNGKQIDINKSEIAVARLAIIF